MRYRPRWNVRLGTKKSAHGRAGGKRKKQVRIEVVPIEIGAEVLRSVRAMTEKDALQIIVQTKRVKINVADKTTIKKATLENQKITVHGADRPR